MHNLTHDTFNNDHTNSCLFIKGVTRFVFYYKINGYNYMHNYNTYNIISVALSEITTK